MKGFLLKDVTGSVTHGKEDRKYPEPMCCISIDDGSQDDITMMEYLSDINAEVFNDFASNSIPITYYLSVGHLAEPKKLEQYYPGIIKQETFLLTQQALFNHYKDYGAEIGCHGWQHRDLLETLDESVFDYWKKETIEAKKQLETWFNQEVNSYSFPYGKVPYSLACMLDELNVFKSMRGYQLRYDWKVDSFHYPDILISEMFKLYKVISSEWSHGLPQRCYPDIHIAGHSKEFVELYKKDREKMMLLFKALKVLGYKFVTASNYYYQEVPF